MDDMESRKFEDAFKDAFAEAKVDPSENVWMSIELDLARAEGGELKRRILFYKLLAAASVTFAMCVAGVGYYTVRHNESNADLIAKNERQMKTEKSELDSKRPTNTELNESTYTDYKTSTSAQKSAIRPYESIEATHERNAGYSRVNSTNSTVGKFEGQTSAMALTKIDEISVQEQFITSSTVDPREASSDYASKVQKLPKTVSAGNISDNIVEVEPDPVAVMMAKLQQHELELREQDKAEKNKKSENLWTSVGFAAGGFNTVNSGGSTPSTSMSSFAATKVADHQAEASGTAYTVGVSMGTRLSNRWVLQGGVNYMAQSSDYTANAVVTSDYRNFQAGSLNEVQSADGDFLASAPYNVNNSLQFISLPVQAGYLIIDRKFGIQLNAGISTDLFIRNTITPESDALSKTTQGRGEDSPYRPLNFSGLLGTELTYRLGEHYRLALNPGIRYPFNSIYKSELGIEAMPLTFDVGMKFRYIFH